MRISYRGSKNASFMMLEWQIHSFYVKMFSCSHHS